MRIDLQFVRSASLLGYPELVTELGGNPEQLLLQSHINPILLRDQDSLIPAQFLCDLLEISATQLDCNNFGLRLSEKQGIAMLGIVGLVVQQAHTLGEALLALKRYLHIHSKAGSFEVEINGDLASLIYTPHFDHQGRNQQLIDLTMGVGLNLFALLVGKKHKPKAVYFSYKEPSDLSLHHRLFKAPLIFNREFNGATMDSKVLSMEIHGSLSEIKPFIDQYLYRLEHASPEELKGKVSVLIRQLIPSGNCSLAQIASMLNVKERTLQRRFKEHDTSYQKLLDDVRKGMAIRYLKESDISITQLSSILGFSDVSVFSRSFRQWVGQSPRQFIAENQLRMMRRPSPLNYFK